MQVSVIIPVYNAEQYLAECLESVLAQTATDFEVLLIDDGSTDGSGALCDRFAAQDARLRVFHIANGGVSKARNLGLDHAQGDFITFIDADDWVDPDHLQQFLDSGIGENGIAFVNMLEEHVSGRIYQFPMPNCDVSQDRAACMSVFAQLMRIRRFGWTCNKFFSRATIERIHLRFDPAVKYSEDELFTVQYCAHVTRVVCNSHATYHYRYVEGSLLHRWIDPQEMIIVRRRIIEQYRVNGFSDEMLYLAARTQFSRLRHTLRHNRGWNSRHTAMLAGELLECWKMIRHYVRPEFRRGFYDRKIHCLGCLACGPGSPFWVKLIIKGLHQ